MSAAIKITKKVVDQTHPAPGADIFVWDAELKGFGFRLKPSGVGQYLVQYRNAERRTRRFKIGGLAVLTPDEARKKAKRLLAEIAHGADPAADREGFRKSLTVSQLCDQYFTDAEKGLVLGRRGSPKKATTLATDKGRIARHIKPLLGARKVGAVTQADVVKFLGDVQNGKTACVVKTKPRGKAVVKGGRGTSARTVGLLGGIFAYAQRNGLRSDNPVRGVQRPADGRKQRFLNPKEYKALGDALLNSEANAPAVVSIVRLLALTGARKNEIVKLQPSEFDLSAPALRLQDTKTGVSIRALGRPAMEILSKRRLEGEWIFPGPTQRRAIATFEKSWPKLFAAAKLVDCTPHTLRHSFATVAGGLGYSELTIASLLGHRQNTVTSRYVQKVDDVLIKAADHIAGEIERLLGGQAAGGARFLGTSASNDNSKIADKLDTYVAENAN